MALETERLLLRPHVPDDLDACLSLVTDAAVTEFIHGLPANREEAWHRLLRYIGHWSVFGFGMFAVFDRADGRLLGEVGVADFHRGLGPAFDDAPEAAWFFHGDSHGRGLAREAARAMLDWFDARRPGERIVCQIDDHNAASIHLAEKLGFRPFGSSVYREEPVTLFERRLADARRT